MKIIARLVLAYIISFTLCLSPLASQKAQASMLTTSQVVDNLTRDTHQKNVTEFLGREDVKNQMMKLGISADEAQRRIASLSDKELKKLSGEIERSEAGGSVAGVLVIVVLVLLIIYLAKRV